MGCTQNRAKLAYNNSMVLVCFLMMLFLIIFLFTGIDGEHYGGCFGKKNGAGMSH